MYRGRYDKPTPPGYSGIAFAPESEREAEKHLKNSPTPVENGAGEEKGVKDTSFAGRQLEEKQRTQSFHSKASEDCRNEVKAMPRNFSGTGKVEAMSVSSSQDQENGDGYAMLSSLFQRKISLEELLLLGTALVLATKEDKGEAFAVFALALMLLDA